MGKVAKERQGKSLPNNCDSHEFILIGKPHLFLKEKITVSFAPVKALEMLDSSQELKSFSVIPRFNFDRKYYSQAFLT